MYPNQKRFYSPQFSEMSAVSVRRLAWSLGVSMPKAVDQAVSYLPCFLRVLSALLVKTTQNAKPVFLASSPPQFRQG
jgi:hypothetical protein